MMRGKIIRGVGGFYYIHPESAAADVLIECKAKGIFRNRNIKPLVGDNVEFEMLDEQAGTGNITEILPRRNALIRPASANVDQAVVVFALSFPKPNLNLLDRFLLMMQTQDIPVIICFNKSDDQEEEETKRIVSQYRACGARVLVTSTINGTGMEELRELLEGRTTVMAGPSGVGKSSVMNILFPRLRWRPERSAARSNADAIRRVIQSCSVLAVRPILWTRRVLPRCVFRKLRRKSCEIIIRNLRSRLKSVVFWDAFISMNRTAVSRMHWNGRRYPGIVTTITSSFMRNCASRKNIRV
nr:ribosome small subunit-dependent GTPase A [Roseburia sp. AM59-24XD]